jgi:hypothetical protein
LLALHPATVQGSRARRRSVWLAHRTYRCNQTFHTLSGVRDCAHHSVDLSLGYDNERA